MTALAFYAALKFWLPMLTGFTFVYSGWKSATRRITEWADRLLNNHLSHIQIATEDTAEAVKEYASASLKLLEEIRNDGKAAAHAVAQVRSDLKEHEDADTDLQGKILLGIEVLKDRI